VIVTRSPSAHKNARQQAMLGRVLDALGKDAVEKTDAEAQKLDGFWFLILFESNGASGISPHQRPRTIHEQA